MQSNSWVHGKGRVILRCKITIGPIAASNGGFRTLGSRELVAGLRPFKEVIQSLDVGLRKRAHSALCGGRLRLTGPKAAARSGPQIAALLAASGQGHAWRQEGAHRAQARRLAPGPNRRVDVASAHRHRGRRRRWPTPQVIPPAPLRLRSPYSRFGPSSANWRARRRRSRGCGCCAIQANGALRPHCNGSGRRTPNSQEKFELGEETTRSAREAVGLRPSKGTTNSL
jgi:hypothetical protein